MSSAKLFRLLQIRSLLCGEIHSENREFTDEDSKYFLDENVSNCLSTLYIKVIGWINDGLTKEEILGELDKLNLECFWKLTDDQQEYVKHDVQSILTIRNKKNERI